jgi:hypothetical protein
MDIPQNILDELTDRTAEDIQYVVIHHTVMNKTADATAIAAAEPFLTIGYNAYVKCVDPANDQWVIEEARPLAKVPAAQYGMNTEGYAIAIGGNYQPGIAQPLDTVSETALSLVSARIQHLKAICPNLKWLIGHRDVATLKKAQGLNPGDYSTECPGDALYSRLHDLRVWSGLHSPPGL